MNQFNDFSIQDEYLEYQYDQDEIIFPGLGQASNLNNIDKDQEMESESELSNSNYSKNKSDLKGSLDTINSIGAQIFKNMTENKSKHFFNQKYCCLKNIGDDIDF